MSISRSRSVTFPQKKARNSYLRRSSYDPHLVAARKLAKIRMTRSSRLNSYVGAAPSPVNLAGKTYKPGVDQPISVSGVATFSIHCSAVQHRTRKEQLNR